MNKRKIIKKRSFFALLIVTLIIIISIFIILKATKAETLELGRFTINQPNTFNASSEAIIGSWKISASGAGNVTATLYEDGRLIVSGTGTMKSFATNTIETEGTWHDLTSVSNIKSIEIENGVWNIGTQAFKGCSYVTSVTLSNDITEIGSSAFSGCSSLSTINMSNQIEKIGTFAFSGCSSLTNINIPSTTNSIGTFAFSECSSLNTINVDSNNMTYSSENGILFNKDKSNLILYPLGKSDITKYSIPNTVTSINERAFNGCTKLTELVIPSSLTKIDDYSFYGMSSLHNIEIPNTITSIGIYAFFQCTSLEDIKIPDTVTSIDSNAFLQCSSLKTVILSNNITSIQGGVFSKCTNLESIVIPDSVTYLGSYVFSECTNLKEIVIPENIENIGINNFYNSKLTIDVNSREVMPDLLKRTQNANDILHTQEELELTDCEWNNNMDSLIINGTKANVKIIDGVLKDFIIEMNLIETADENEPSIDSVTGNPTEWTNKDVTLTVNATDNESGIALINGYSFDNGEHWQTENTKTYSQNTSNIIIKVKDNKENIATYSDIINIDKIDKVAPNVTVSADKETYYEGETATITAIFNEDIKDGTPKISINGFSTLASTEMTKNSSKIYTYNYVVPKGNGTQTITISDASDLAGNVMDDNKTKKINVESIVLSNIAVTTVPEKIAYIEGENFDSTGMKVTATYSNNFTKEITNYTIIGGDNLTSDTTSITISYTENEITRTTSQPITVAKKTLTNIEITEPPTKTTYIEGQNFDPTGMKIIAKYSDNSFAEITNYTITDGNDLKTDKTSVTISYTENNVTKTATQSITVSKKVLNAIVITTKPNKTEYIEEQNFDTTGMKVTATYNDGTSKEVTNYTVTDGNKLTVGKTTVTVSYTENEVTKTVDQAIMVSKKTLSSIRIFTAPNKTTYIEGQNFDATGMKVTAIYNNSTNKEVTDYTITGGNNLTTDKTSVIISYTESSITKTTTQPITVTKKLEISFDGYNEVNKDGNKYIDNIAPSTTMENLINNIETNGTITVYKDNKEITDKKIKISTGMKVKISLNNENHEFTIVVKGDTNGDGESDLRDLLQLNKHRLNKTLLIAEYLLAGDVNKDNEVNLKDLLQINKFRLGKINTL